MPIDKKQSLKGKNAAPPGRSLKQTAAVYSKKTTLLEEAITQMNAGKYGRSSSALKELLAMDPHNMEARRLFATLHLRLGSLIPARQAFDSLVDEAFARQDYWLAESLLREYLAAGPRCVPYLEKLGLIHQDKGETNEAVEQYGKAIDILVEDPDPDNPNHAYQLYEKIKDLAPGSFVARRVAEYFDTQTGALIARQAGGDGSHDSTDIEYSVAGADSEPMAEIAPWTKSEESASADEVDAPPEPLAPVVEAGDALQQFEEAAEAVFEVLPAPDPSMTESETVYGETEPTSTLSDDSAGFALQQTEVLENPPQAFQQETVERSVSESMPWAEVQETTSDMPNVAATESSEPSSFAPTPVEALPGGSTDVEKGGAFSWDSVFKTVWNKQDEGAPATNVPTTDSLEVGALPLSKPDATEVSSAGAPMPWDQVQDSTIRISPKSPEQSVGESSNEQVILPVSSSETMTWSYQQPVAEPASPSSLTQPIHAAAETSELSFTQPSPSQSTFETEPVSAGAPSFLSPAASSNDAQEAQSQPFTFAFAGEPPAPTEEPPSALAWNATNQSSALEEATPPPAQYENFSFSLDKGPVEAPSDSYIAGLGQVAVPEHASSGNAVDSSCLVSDSVRDENDRHFSAQDQAQQEEWSKPSFIEAKAPLLEPSPQSEGAWNKPGESIRFIEASPAVADREATPKSSLWGVPKASAAASPVASAVDALFEAPSDSVTDTEPRERSKPQRPRRKSPGIVSRIGATLSSFISSCFSTTRAIVMSLIALAVFSCAVAALAVGAVGLTWMIMEESPSPAYQAFTAGPPQTMSDSSKNGYVVLLGLDAAAGQNLFQDGYEQTSVAAVADKMHACLGGPGDSAPTASVNASEKVLNSWFSGSDPVGQFRANQGVINRWATQGEGTLARYRRWQRLPFEDWGYGRLVVPPCATINFAHRLYVAEGFAQQTNVGIDRLEADMAAWRTVLVQARTLPVKMLAIQAVRDDAAVAAGLLARPDFDGQYVGHLSHMLRPLSQAELSIRWPMQSELVWAAKTFDAQVKAEKREGQPLYAAVASVLPLPSQRRLNRYAAYYEASNKASETGQHSAMPKLSGFVKSPASGVMDYFTNPIENVIGLHPLPAWDLYNGLAVDADAHLRLASLQAWIRRGWQDSELLSRIAKAGQTFYDPYTGLPMLVNMKKRVLYSVGKDLKDQDGDPQYDVVVDIPGNPAFLPSGSAPAPSKPY